MATDAGRVYVFRHWNETTSTFPAPDTLEHTAHPVGARLGFSVSGGDINKNGAADILAGAPYYSVNPGDNKGKVCIFWGTPFNPPNPNQEERDSGYGTMTHEHYGTSVAFVLKTIPGTLPCFIGGAPEANPTGVANQGATVIYQYSP